MKAVVKRQYAEFIEQIEFPTVIYIYETGKILAQNGRVRRILGTNLKNMNSIWYNQTKQKYPRDFLNYGSTVFYQKEVKVGNDKLEIDMEVTSFLLDHMHILVCFMEQSYKKAFDRHLRIRLPRLFIKNKKREILSINSMLGEDNPACLEDWLSQNHAADEREVMQEKVCRYQLEQFMPDENEKAVFIKIIRIPVINKNGTCEGILSIYTHLLEKEEYERVAESDTREKYILNKVVERSDIVAFCVRDLEGWPVEYMSSNLKQYGIHTDYFPKRGFCLKDMIYPRDYEKIWKDYRNSNNVKPETLEYRLVKPDGETIWFRDETLCIIADGGIRYRAGLLSPINKDNQSDYLALYNREDNVKRNRKYVADTYPALREALAAQTAGGVIMEEYLRKAIAKDCVEFDIYYQAIVDSKSKKLAGAEALLRWKSPELGFINPMDFIPLSEYLGLIVPLGEHVIRKVFETSRRWNDALGCQIFININLSVVQLVQPDIVDHIRMLAEEFQVDCSGIVFEVTESLAIEDMTLMKNVLLELKKMGFKIALDDFGTGYSSLNHVMEMPLDYIKIDKNFIAAYGTEKFNPSLLSAITELAHSMNVRIIVEGVETKQQMEFLMFINTDEYQGYLYGRPVPAEEFYSGIKRLL